MLTQEQLKHFLHYDPDTGIFTWRVGRRGHWGDRVAGSFTKRGYLRIKLGQKEYRATSLIWLYMTGAWPVYVVDHKDRNPRNNKWLNLREATFSQNGANSKVQSNNKLGLKGVCKVGDKFQAQLKKDGKTIYLGLHATPELAHAAYNKAALHYHGQFAHIQEAT
jgi:HNH endonuclease